jgi:hypothetical protein
MSIGDWWKDLETFKLEVTVIEGHLEKQYQEYCEPQDVPNQLDCSADGHGLAATLPGGFPILRGVVPRVLDRQTSAKWQEQCTGTRWIGGASYTCAWTAELELTATYRGD